MQHAEKYKIIVSAENGKVVILLQPQKGEPVNSYLLYDGGDHAFLYRHSHDVILLDNLNPQIIPLLSSAAKAIVIEADWDSNLTIFDYVVDIKHEKYA